MPMEYDEITAKHYAAYRPPLHLEILKETGQEYNSFGLGLDVGCGTGHSTIALSNYCEKVIGVDPSKEMLATAIKNPKVSYRSMLPEKLDFKNNSIDFITFAGSLYYAKSQALLNEVIRVSKPCGYVLIYDFEIVLDKIFSLLGIDNFPQNDSGYDHQTDFTGLEQSLIKMDNALKKEFDIEVRVLDLTHLLMSAKDNYTILMHTLGHENLYDKISKKLRSAVKSEVMTLKSITYFTGYKVLK